MIFPFPSNISTIASRITDLVQSSLALMPPEASLTAHASLALKMLTAPWALPGRRISNFTTTSSLPMN